MLSSYQCQCGTSLSKHISKMNYLQFIDIVLKLSFFSMDAILRLPYDWKNPLGYSVAVAIQAVTAIYGLLFLVSLASVGTTTFFFTKALIRDINGLLRNINKNTKIEKQHGCILKQFSEFIQYHSDVKQLCKSQIYLFTSKFNLHLKSSFM